MPDVPTLTLTNGVRIPQLGFGVFQVPPEDTVRTVREALDAGYRSIDTATRYDNEREVGQAIRESGLPRDEVFVTTKLKNGDHGRDRTLAAFERSMADLGLDVLDLYLIHWPQQADDYVETWQVFEELHRDGRIRAVGVSNFQPHHLRRLMDETETVPAVNQIEMHPWLVQEQLRAFNAEHGIVTEAWSPLAQGGELLQEPVIGAIAERHDRQPAQVVLRWHLQRGVVVIPKSVTPARIRSNIAVFDFELSAEEMTAITALDRGLRTGPDPDVFG
ncbi:diketogulonate reductase-like aldo/keto reductase [Kineococcus xinjiangensis]|uniref:Diketogulonate reductase-like aldo/keto reductase n=1 Tax=Kineococcus xinjiangensis TaxID=512762 RepID=A0A2S6IVD4_9ACTN|nr:aldo/keto reductase [Kineococcus xinjiangensis]PPK98221.1 diketogulonate reductase-like aldo/keto reductase [Kineococcus xinjiangensis]